MRFFLAVLVSSVSLAAALQECTPETCAHWDCPGATEELCRAQGKEFRPNVTACGCCSLCVGYIPTGRPCSLKKYWKGAEKYMVGGNPPIQKHCQPGNTCLENKCQRIL